MLTDCKTDNNMAQWRAIVATTKMRVGEDLGREKKEKEETDHETTGKHSDLEDKE